MTIWNKLLLVAAAPLALSGCLWSPGRFNSTLDVRKDGQFTLDYQGEILFEMPKQDKPNDWTDDKAHCFADGAASLDITASGAEDRDCSPQEIAKLKAEFAKKEAERLAEKRKESEEMARVFGLPGGDDASNRKFAETLKKYAGWRAVTYKGRGVYEVDYHFTGTLTQDYAFPIMPDTDLVLPFISIRRRADGSVFVAAPALAGGEGPFGARARMLGLPDKGESGEKMRAQGRFTITTDGEILTNNTENGPAPHARGRALVWDVSPASTKTPETLIRL